MRFIIALFLAMTLHGCQQPMAKRARTMRDIFARLDERSKKDPHFSDTQRVAALKEKYVGLFNGKRLDFSRYNDEVLRDFWGIFGTMSFHSRETKYLVERERVFEELKKRDIHKASCKNTGSKGSCVGDLFFSYVSFGDFAKAKQLRLEYPDILSDEPIPEITEDPGLLEKPRKLYEVSQNGEALKLFSLESRKGPEILAVLSPGCHFSRRALDIIASSPDFREAFREYATIIYPINVSLSAIPDIARWNREHPELRYYLHSDNEAHIKGWEGLDFSSTPQFYFMNDGKIAFQIGGWGPTDDKFRENLSAGIQQIKKASPEQ